MFYDVTVVDCSYFKSHYRPRWWFQTVVSKQLRTLFLYLGVTLFFFSIFLFTFLYNLHSAFHRPKKCFWSPKWNVITEVYWCIFKLCIFFMEKGVYILCILFSFVIYFKGQTGGLKHTSTLALSQLYINFAA